MSESRPSTPIAIASKRQETAPSPDRSIVAINVTKEFETNLGSRQVLRDISFSVGPGERMAILGRNGAGKSTLIKILAGVLKPSSGRLELGMSLSWPLALAGGFEGELTGYDNVRFVCDIYNVSFNSVFSFVQEFTELDYHIYSPVHQYSDGMRARLAFGLSLAIEFDCILIDEVLGVGDQRFREKCHHELFVRRKNQSIIAAVHAPDFVTQHCSKALVLKGGRSRLFTDTTLATQIYATL